MTTLAGVVQAEIGVRYDVALGPDLGATTTMIGYTLAAGTQWTESTDIADNQRIVQISSPNQTDRFTFYPKVSQGSWNGGERQITFVDPTRYYQSNKLETSLDGHLYIRGRYFASATLGGTPPVPVGFRCIQWEIDSASGANAWYGGVGVAGGNAVKIVDNVTSAPTLTAATISNVNDTVFELARTPSRLYAIVQAGTNPGLYRSQTTWQRVTTDTNIDQGQRSMAYFNNAMWYFDTSNPNKLLNMTPLALGGGAGTTQYTLLAEEADSATQSGVRVLGSTATGLMFAVAGGVATAGTLTRIYTFDGTTQTLVGDTDLYPVDILEASGITFLLFAGYKLSSSYQPVLMAYYGGQLSVFDDYRYLPVDFQGTVTSADANLSTDGTYLYMAWPSMNTMRYDLRVFPAVAVSNVGDPRAVGAVAHSCAVNASGTMVEVIEAQAKVWLSNLTGPQGATVTNDTGFIVTSFFDMGTPSTTKVFRSLEIELNAAMVAGASVAVKYNLDNQTAFANSLTVTTLSSNNLICFFPANVKAARVQFKLTLTSGNSSGASPDIRSYSVNGRLGRVWKGTVQCRRQVTTQDGALDQQGQRSQDLLANIVNVYQKAAGNAILFVPDATSSTGVSQVNAVLEDYTIKTPKPGPSLSEQASADMEADVECTFVERL